MRVPDELFERVLSSWGAIPLGPEAEEEMNKVIEDLRRLQLPAATFKEVDGRKVLCCPHGHDGPFRHLEDAVLYREVEPRAAGDDEKLITVNGYYQARDEDTDNERLECHALLTPELSYGQECLAGFAIPAGWKVDFI